MNSIYRYHTASEYRYRSFKSQTIRTLNATENLRQQSTLKIVAENTNSFGESIKAANLIKDICWCCRFVYIRHIEVTSAVDRMSAGIALSSTNNS